MKICTGNKKRQPSIKRSYTMLNSFFRMAIWMQRSYEFCLFLYEIPKLITKILLYKNRMISDFDKWIWITLFCSFVGKISVQFDYASHSLHFSYEMFEMVTNWSRLPISTCQTGWPLKYVWLLITSAQESEFEKRSFSLWGVCVGLCNPSYWGC